MYISYCNENYNHILFVLTIIIIESMKQDFFKKKLAYTNLTKACQNFGKRKK